MIEFDQQYIFAILTLRYIESEIYDAKTCHILTRQYAIIHEEIVPQRF